MQVPGGQQAISRFGQAQLDLPVAKPRISSGENTASQALRMATAQGGFQRKSVPATPVFASAAPLRPVAEHENFFKNPAAPVRRRQTILTPFKPLVDAAKSHNPFHHAG